MQTLIVASLVLLAVLAIFLAIRAINAVRRGVMSMGPSEDAQIRRRRNPFAFWFFVLLFSTFAAALSYHSASSLLDMANAA